MEVSFRVVLKLSARSVLPRIGMRSPLHDVRSRFARWRFRRLARWDGSGAGVWPLEADDVELPASTQVPHVTMKQVHPLRVFTNVYPFFQLKVDLVAQDPQSRKGSLIHSTDDRSIASKWTDIKRGTGDGIYTLRNQHYCSGNWSLWEMP
ncbi:hypothetical protein BaRGS_00039436, partial [Batillaria attramentaria]